MVLRHLALAVTLSLGAFAAHAASFQDTTDDGVTASYLEVDSFTSLSAVGVNTFQFDLDSTNAGLAWDLGPITLAFSAPVTFSTPQVLSIVSTSGSSSGAVSVASFTQSGNTFTVDVDGLLDGGNTYQINALFLTPTNATAEVSFSATAVPEPESYAMMIAGLSAMGFMARRRKNKA